jgi:alpha-tubulin suppressor-like RCC1 family protein
VLFANERALCFGRNHNGQLGRDSIINLGPGGDVLTSAPLISFSNNLLGIVQIATGPYHTCVLRADHGVLCFGLNDSGQLGAGHTMTLGDNSGETSSLAPISFDPVNITYASSELLSVVLSSGDSITMNKGQTFYIVGAPKAREMFIASYVKANPASTVYIKSGSDGQLLYMFNIAVTVGSTSTTRYDILVRMRPSSMIVAGGSHACLLSPARKVVCWGSNAKGQLGRDNSANIGATPGDMAGLAPIVFGSAFSTMSVVSITAGREHSCALFSGGKVSCWGTNDFGQLGLNISAFTVDTKGGDMESLTPVELSLTITHTVTQVVAAFDSTCGIVSNFAYIYIYILYEID